MRLPRRHVLAAGVISLALTESARARAADIAPDGTLVFAKDALATYGFESFADLQVGGAALITWSSAGFLTTSALAPGDEATLLTGAADALQGGHGLLVRRDLGAGLALRDDTVFAAAAGQRLSVTMWGRAFGAEPVLEVVYAHNTTNVGPGRFHVIAVRTGRETSDGWVEYATGPVDGSVWGTPLRAIVLTARYATDQGASLLVGKELSPTASGQPVLLDSSAHAVIDAVEVRPEPGAVEDAATCTQATVDAACGPGGDCEFGHCVDGSVVWGAVPQAEDHRRDLVARWAFQAASLHGDRKATATAAVSFAGQAAALSAVQTPRGFFGKLNQLVTGLRDSHTALGSPGSWDSTFYPIPDSYSGPLDVCFGLAQNDLATGETVFAVFATGPKPSISEKILAGDVLTAIDGQPPKDWLAAAVPRFASTQPNDPGADPSFTALILPDLVGRFASTLTFSRCQPGGGCAALPDIPVGEEVFKVVSSNGGTQGYSQVCTLRFHPAVSSPPIDGASTDAVVFETVNGVTSVQLDGFEGLYTTQNAWHAWEDPWTSAFAAGPRMLVDARLGHGGKFTLGKFLFQLARGTDQPYGMFAMPRGAYDDPDPAWLFGSSWDACKTGDGSVDACHWTAGQTSFTQNAAPAGGATKIAWVNGNDVSMNDIVPRLMAGRSDFRVFGPHPSHGAYGEVSKVPPILSAWRPGSMQVLDMRFGATPALARAGTWESGKGVVPDQVVLQKVSDILADQDTVLTVAKAWVAQ